jgi:hypothetical protein
MAVGVTNGYPAERTFAEIGPVRKKARSEAA